MWLHRIVGGAMALLGLAGLGGLIYFVSDTTAQAEHFGVWIGVPGLILTAAACLIGIALGLLYAAAPQAVRQNARRLFGDRDR